MKPIIDNRADALLVRRFLDWALKSYDPDQEMEEEIRKLIAKIDKELGL